MSLFIGNLSRDVKTEELQDAFSHYGSCKVSHRGPYGFVEYDKEGDADAAKNELSGKRFSGFAINIEWSKKSGRFEPRGRPSRGRRGPPRRRRSYDRSRSRSRDHSRSRSRSPRYRRERERSGGRHSNRRDYRRRSPSISSRSKSRSSRSNDRDRKKTRSPLPQQPANSKSRSSEKVVRDQPSPNN